MYNFILPLGLAALAMALNGEWLRWRRYSGRKWVSDKLRWRGNGGSRERKGNDFLNPPPPNIHTAAVGTFSTLFRKVSPSNLQKFQTLQFISSQYAWLTGQVQEWVPSDPETHQRLQGLRCSTSTKSRTLLILRTSKFRTRSAPSLE